MFNIFSLTSMISYTLPLKMGLPARIYLLNKKADLKLLHISTLLVVDGLINYLCWGVVSVGSLFLISRMDLVDKNILLFFILSILFLFLCLMLWKRKDKLTARFTNSGKSEDPSGSLKDFIATLGPGILAAAVVVMLLDICSHAFRHWAIFSMLDISLELQVIFVITTVSLFTGILSMMPMGLGGYDGMLIFLLIQFSVPAEYAVGIALINRITSLTISIVLGLYSGHQLSMNPFGAALRRELMADRVEKQES